MNKKLKILSGSVIVSALVIIITFLAVDNNKPNKINNSVPTIVEVSGEKVDVDSLLTDLEGIDNLLEEPVYSDEDLSIDLINSNYEIQ